MPIVLRLNSRRTSKPDGKKKKVRNTQVQDEPVVEEEEVAQEQPEESGPARSQANPYAQDKTKEKQTKNTPQFISTFQSSNIDAVAYDPEKQQLWVRFKGKDVYTYFDVPLMVYRGFWSAPSKGHYFWEKIRKNKHIKYQKLTASLKWILLKDAFPLNAAVAPQANPAAVARSLKKKLKSRHPEWNVQPELITLFNGFRLLFDDHSIEICRYSNKIRVNIKDERTGKIDFSTTAETDTQKIVDYIMKRTESRLQSLAASRSVTVSTVDNAAVLQLLAFLEQGLPEAKWEALTTRTRDGYSLASQLCDISIQPADSELRVEVQESLTGKVQVFHVRPDALLTTGLTKIMATLLQGVASEEEVTE